MFGTPFAPPGVNPNYEWGPLGGLRKAEATWDLDAIGDLAKMLPGAMNMMPGMFPGMMGPGMMSYKKVSYPAQVRKKTISTINNAALDEVAKQNPNSTAAQNNKSSKKNEIKCPPGSVYDSERGHCVDELGNMVRSIVDLPDPEELLGNPFENPNARMLNGKKTMKATGPSSSASSTAATQSTQAPSVGGAPLQSQQTNIPGLIDYGQDWAGNVAKSEEMYNQRANTESLISTIGEDPSQYGYMIDHATGEVIKNPKGTDVDQRGLVWSGKYDDENTGDLDESLAWSNPYSPEEFQKSQNAGNYNSPSYIVTNPDGTQSSVRGYTPGSEFSPWYNKKKEATDARIKAAEQQASYIANMPKDVRAKKYKEINKQYGSDILDANGNFTKDYESYFSLEENPVMDYDFIQKQFGGPISGVEPDEYGNLQKFIYGGDEYAYGGDVLPKAYDGYITNFQKQMNATKNRIDQMGSNSGKSGLLTNPWNRSDLTNGIPNTLAVQPSGTVGNRFQPTGQPNAGTTTQGGTGTTTNTNQTKTTTTTNQGQPQFDANTMAQFQQYMQMMQGQQGMGQGQFSVGRPQRLGFGLTRDFNYSNAFSPVNWQVPEGTKGIKQTAYKDRGKWYNPFDTKRITEWRIDNGEIPDSDKSKSEMQDKAGTTTNINNQDISTTEGSQEDVQDDQARDATGKIGNDEMLATNVNDQEEIVGIGNKGEVINSPQFYNERNTQRYTGTDIDGEKMYENYGDKDRLNEAFDITGFSKKDFRNQGPALFGDTEGGTRSELANEYEGKGFFGKRKMRKDFMKNDLWDMPLDSGVINERRGNAKIAPNTFKGPFSKPGESNPTGDPKYIPTGEDFNFASPASGSAGGNNKPAPVVPQGNEDYLDPLPMAYGGYIPAYMAYGGYMPDYGYGGYLPKAKPGITVDKAEFNDPNLIGKTVEQSAYTFNPGQLATDLFSGPTSLTGLTTGFLNARDEAKKMNQAAQMSRTSDAATANTGQSGFGSAERKGSDLMASGNETQYGSTPGKQGYEGGLYGKKGGEMNSQYAKGKVYSLTMEQIKAIEAAGGKVEYIK
jgi:hypothetical protein